jgi:hypothetical protein
MLFCYNNFSNLSNLKFNKYMKLRKKYTYVNIFRDQHTKNFCSFFWQFNDRNIVKMYRKTLIKAVLIKRKIFREKSIFSNKK